MTQYTEYQIVEALLAQDLIETVKQNMAEGWTCQGGPAWAGKWHQAMVR